MSSVIPSVKVAMGDDFLLAFSQLPKNAQKKARAFIEKFRSDPASTGLNYEKIHACSDPNLRSLRVDQDYRAIILKPENGNTYILLWVDKHDDAYDWAKGKKCSIHPNTGSIQVLASQPGVFKKAETTLHAKTKAIDQTVTRLFDPFKNSELLEVGIPEDAIDLVRSVVTEPDLDAIEDSLPPEVFEALFYLAIGNTLEETKRELGIETPAEVDRKDFAAALQRASAQRKFVVISDSEEMEKILSYPLDRWRTFLHPSQRKIVQMNAKGPVRVLGGAGTGKTVVAIHRAKWLAEHVCNKHEKVLFTTYTKNLAIDIENNLKKICSHEILQKIEVKNMDAWASRFLAAKSKKSRRVDFEGKQTRELWSEALTYTPANCPLNEDELEREWKYVLQAQGIRKEADYIRVSRIGMGKALTREKRKEIWPIFEEFISLQKENGLCEPIEALQMAHELLETQKIVTDYRAVLIDEAQDFSAIGFKLANAIVPSVRAENGNHLFIVGDAHQRLYGHKVILSHCGIEIRGRSRKLRINYRTSEETKRWATAVLEDCPIDDLDGGLDDQKGYRSLFHGEEPVNEPCSSYEEQLEAIIAHVKNLLDQGAKPESICIVARTNKLCEALAHSLTQKEIETLAISKGKGNDSTSEKLRIATMHRVKGIEFDHVILSHMEAENWLKNGEISVENRCLIYVAATRARKSVFITSAGAMPTEINPIRK